MLYGSAFFGNIFIKMNGVLSAATFKVKDATRPAGIAHTDQCRSKSNAKGRRADVARSLTISMDRPDQDNPSNCGGVEGGPRPLGGRQSVRDVAGKKCGRLVASNEASTFPVPGLGSTEVDGAGPPFPESPPGWRTIQVEADFSHTTEAEDSLRPTLTRYAKATSEFPHEVGFWCNDRGPWRSWSLNRRFRTAQRLQMRYLPHTEPHRDSSVCAADGTLQARRNASFPETHQLATGSTGHPPWILP